MTVRTNSLGDTYDDRFVCKWHYYPPDDEHPLGFMGWCGLDCPTQRYRVACRIEADLVSEGRLPSRAYRHDEQWDRLRRWAVTR